MVDLPRVFLTSEEQRKVYEVRIYETLGLVICLVHYRTLAEFEVKAPKDYKCSRGEAMAAERSDMEDQVSV